MTAAWASMLTIALLIADLPLQGPADPSPHAMMRAVISDRLEIRDEPTEARPVVGFLSRGDRVEVVREAAEGWVAIRPRPDADVWILADAVVPLRNGDLYVDVPSTRLKSSTPAVDEVGPPGSVVSEGAVLTPGRKPPIEIVYGRRSRRYLSVVEPGGPIGERFVLSSGLESPALATKSPEIRATEPAVRRASFVENDPVGLPPDLVGSFRNVEEGHRAILARPIESWDLEPIRRDYRALMAGLREPAALGAIRSRLDQIDREDEMAKSAREFEGLVRRSRQRDAVVERTRDSIKALRASEVASFDAEGLLQRSSKRVEGEKVFVLLDDEGLVVTYLKLPTGVDARNLLSRQVGVRGKSRFDEGLRFRLIEARDVEPTGPER